jgi:peptidoglycan/LPS O-acetylase OafA/YrhL
MNFIQNTGVVVFFVLSGIVIPYSTSSKIAKSSSYSFSSYFIDRFSRIYTGFVPALFFVIAVDILRGFIFGNPYISAFNIQTFFGNLLMLQDFPFQNYPIDFFTHRFSGLFNWIIPITSFGSARPLWVVAIMWWIYLLFGWIVLGKVHREKHPVIYCFILAFLLIVPSYNVTNGRGNGLSMMWFMGLLIYIMLSRFWVNLSNRYLCILAGVFLFAGLHRLYLTRDAYDVLYVGLLALALYFALCFLQRREIAIPKFVSSIIVFNAGFSYTLYLVHYTLLDIFVSWRGPGVSNLLIGFVLSNIAAIGMYSIFERNDKAVRHWLKKFLKITE